jgi:chaperonin GroEL
MSTTGVLSSPGLHRRLKEGFNALGDTLAVTLGPRGRHVLIQSATTGKPEMFSDGATIARRMIEMPGRAQNVGLMMMRNLIWETHLQAGDGTATAAVLAQAIYNEAYKLRAAGANVMDLRRGIERATETVAETLRAMARPVTGEDELAQIALTITGEPKLSRVLGEMFDILGEDAHITVEHYLSPIIDREYHQGGHWRGRLASPHFGTEPGGNRAVLAACAVILFDGSVTDVDDALAVLECAAQIEPKRVVIVARSIRGAALNALITAQQSRRIELIAAEVQEVGQAGTDDLEDLAALTGAKLLSREAGSPLTALTARDLGRALRVEADQKSLVVVGQFEHAQRVRDRIAVLRARRDRLNAASSDKAAAGLGQRIARLSGSAGTLKVGALSEPERDVLRQKTETCIAVLPSAMRGGILPGGGVAYLNCIARLKALEAKPEERWGISAVARALEAPFKRIVRNSGNEAPDAALQSARACGESFGFDALSGQIADMTQAGVCDSADVLITAFRTAASGAMMALTIDSVVLSRNPKTSATP